MRYSFLVSPEVTTFMMFLNKLQTGLFFTYDPYPQFVLTNRRGLGHKVGQLTESQSWMTDMANRTHRLNFRPSVVPRVKWIQEGPVCTTVTTEDRRVSPQGRSDEIEWERNPVGGSLLFSHVPRYRVGTESPPVRSREQGRDVETSSRPTPEVTPTQIQVAREAGWDEESVHDRFPWGWRVDI